MKLRNYSLLFLALCAMAFCGCDSNKGKLKDCAAQFIAAYNDGDKAAIFEMFPEIKKLSNLSIAGVIGQGGDISVEKDDSTGNYIVTINEQKQQRLEFAIDSIGGIKIVDTYGVFRLDSIASELAFKTGVPVKKMSDVIMARLMNPESDFINDLRTTKGQNNLSAHSGSYSWGHRGDGSYVSMDFTVRNNSSQTVSGKDYYLVITPRRYSTGKVYQSKTVDGIDIAPNEVREFNVLDPPLYSIADDRDLTYSVEIKYRTESILAFLLNYGELKGDEFEEYLAHPYRYKVMSRGKLGVISAGEKGIAYAYENMSAKSKVVDTLYHGKTVSMVWEDEEWASIYSGDFNIIGYVQDKDIDKTNSVARLDLIEMTLKSDNGKIHVYDVTKGTPTDKVIKTLSAGQKVWLELGEDGDPILYERQPNGSMIKIGRIDSNNVVYDW